MVEDVMGTNGLADGLGLLLPKVPFCRGSWVFVKSQCVKIYLSARLVQELRELGEHRLGVYALTMTHT